MVMRGTAFVGHANVHCRRTARVVCRRRSSSIADEVQRRRAGQRARNSHGLRLMPSWAVPRLTSPVLISTRGIVGEQEQVDAGKPSFDIGGCAASHVARNWGAAVLVPLRRCPTRPWSARIEATPASRHRASPQPSMVGASQPERQAVGTSILIVVVVAWRWIQTVQVETNGQERLSISRRHVRQY